MQQDANGITRHFNTVDEHPHLEARVSEREGSGVYTISGAGTSVNYTLRDGGSPGSPRNRATVADLERKLFRAACDSPAFDHKPRENIRNRFLQFNTVESLGPIPRPPARVLNNPSYQENLARSGRAV